MQSVRCILNSMFTHTDSGKEVHVYSTTHRSKFYPPPNHDFIFQDCHWSTTVIPACRYPAVCLQHHSYISLIHRTYTGIEQNV